MIYLLNNREELVEIINHGDIYVNNEKIRLTDENYVSYIFTAEIKYLPAHITEQVSYVMVGADDNYQAYFVSNIETNNDRTAITGVSSIVEQLRKTIVPKLIGEQTLQSALTEALRKTDIELIIDASIASKQVYSELYYVQAWEAIKELSHYYGFEMDFRVNYNSAESEQHDAYRKKLVVTPALGVDKPEEAVIYGYNAKSFVSEHDKTNIVTALYGFGKPVTQTKRFKDYEKKVQERLKELHGRHWQSFMPEYGFDENNPPKVDFSAISSSDKPYGAAYIGINELSSEMTSLGIYNRTTGQYEHKFEVMHFAELEDPQAILNATRQELKRRIKEEMYYQVTADGLNVDIGDAIQVGSDDILADSAVDKARVIEFTRDNLLNRNKDIRIGEHITKSRNRKRRELKEDLGIEPLVNDPALSNFGTPSERGYGTDLSSPLRGIDDLLFDSLAGLDDFGDWGLDELGNTGLDFSTLDSGLNTGDFGSGNPGDDGDGGFSGHGPYLKLAIDSAAVNKFPEDDDVEQAKKSTTLHTGEESVIELGSTGSSSANAYMLGDEDGNMTERRADEHEASITVHGYDGGIDIDKPVTYGRAATAYATRDMWMSLVNMQYNGFDINSPESALPDGAGRLRLEGTARTAPLETSMNAMEFEDSPLKLAFTTFSKHKSYETLNNHPYSTSFNGIVLSVGVSNKDLEADPSTGSKNGVMFTENNGLFIKDIHTTALIEAGKEDYKNVADGTASDLFDRLYNDGYLDMYGSTGTSSVDTLPQGYLSLTDFIKYTALGLFDDLDVVEHRDILTNVPYDSDASPIPSEASIDAGATRETYREAILAKRLENVGNLNQHQIDLLMAAPIADPGKYIHSQLMEHWSSSELHNLSSQLSPNYLTKLRAFYKDVHTAGSRSFRDRGSDELNDLPGDHPTYRDIMWMDEYQHAHTIGAITEPVSDYYTNSPMGAAELLWRKFTDNGPEDDIKWNSKKGIASQNRVINMLSTNQNLTAYINAQQVALAKVYKEQQAATTEE